MSDPDPILLVDLASLVHPLFHMSGSQPDPNWASVQAVARVHALSPGRAHVAVCVDSPKSWRKEKFPTYKGNRPKQEEPLIHQLQLTESTLRADGFPIWGAEGFEADDVISSAVKEARQRTMPVCIASSDKDLLQLVDNEAAITVQSLRDGRVYDAEQVEIKFGVVPVQMRDFLTLVGDSSDNIKGVPGIGPKRAADLLRRFESLDILLANLDDDQAMEGVTPSTRTALRTSINTIAQGRVLVTLRDDVPVPFDQIFDPRISQQSEAAMSDELHPIEDQADPVGPPPPDRAATSPALPARVTLPDVVNGSVAWERALEPRGLDDARTISKWLHTSRLFAAYGSPEAIFSIVLAGRELGLGTLASLRGFHIIEGKPTLSADLLRALVMRSGDAEYFTPVERTAEKATWTTKRKTDPAPVTLTFTIDEARSARLIRPNSQWEKGPADMLAKTASAKLCRLVYPELGFGLYAPAELGSDEL